MKHAFGKRKRKPPTARKRRRPAGEAQNPTEHADNVPRYLAPCDSSSEADNRPVTSTLITKPPEDVPTEALAPVRTAARVSNRDRVVGGDAGRRSPSPTETVCVSDASCDRDTQPASEPQPSTSYILYGDSRLTRRIVARFRRASSRVLCQR